MAWTYTADPGPAGTAAATAQNDLDAVRLCIADTDEIDQLLQDTEIQWFMFQECGVTSGAMNVYRIAAVCCYQLATRFSRYADKWIGPAKLYASQKAKAYKDRGDEWLLKSRMWSTSIYAGGISVADKWNVENNTDRVIPSFSKNMQTPLSTVDSSDNWLSLHVGI